MKNFVCDDDLVPVVAPAGGVTSGKPVLIGALFGVPVADAAEGEPFTLATEGVFDLGKDASVFAAGGKVSFDPTAKTLTAPGTGKAPVGVALAAAASGAATVRVKLDGIATAAA